MHVINAANVNDAYRDGLRLLLTEGRARDSRNGPVVRVDAPVATVYRMPRERVLFDRQRHANPFFHLFEALWMLNGGNDVETMDGFLKSFKQFSDDGETFHGAYGHRWRHWPNDGSTYYDEIDQISIAIRMLKKDPTSRRVVIGMWDPVRDLDADSKDIPCNDLIKLSIQDDTLHMIVFNRSNDVIWGCYGANAVHMSILHEYLSRMIGVHQGTLTQISCDFHAYTAEPYNLDSFIPADLWDKSDRDPYLGVVVPHLVADTETFDGELRSLMDHIRSYRSVKKLDRDWFTNPFFSLIAIPMHLAWEAIRASQHNKARDILMSEGLLSVYRRADWIQSGIDWIDETLRRKLEKT